ncbi:MAG: phosphatidate cytidylyltransferase [Acidaminococcaceae bacterium]|jgi:phosphatidate cytidylyltransferase|nr:phosphatidate cytidylyltransferase [Acidaminococcaceae bacterium]MCI2109783.1 phosphatidate cytidylyltransferase [Acidaminococcaceae bacterium]
MKQRIITAIIAIPIALFLIRMGGVLYAAGVTVLAYVGWRELRNMLVGAGDKIYAITGCLPVLALVIAAAVSGDKTILPILVISVIAIMLDTLFHYRDGRWISETALGFFGVMYVGVLFAHFVFLRNLTGKVYSAGFMGQLSLGEALLWTVMFGTWASDTFAYIFGCNFGKHKLLPAVSPKKSVEGAVAGFIGCILVIQLLGSLWLGFSGIKVLALGILVGIVAPLGDLVESILKRSCNIKDSGSFFPGHGGVLDRCDSLLFAVPVAYYYIKWFLL